ncbi:MAG TPA: hypothetical protein VGK20_19110 [Candidatus Binatia bacterium]|jgi:hypothetical protein
MQLVGMPDSPYVRPPDGDHGGRHVPFPQLTIPQVVVAADHPSWREFAESAETLPEFLALPQQ